MASTRCRCVLCGAREIESRLLYIQRCEMWRPGCLSLVGRRQPYFCQRDGKRELDRGLWRAKEHGSRALGRAWSRDLQRGRWRTVPSSPLKTACKSLKPFPRTVFLQFSACAPALKVCPPHVMTSNPASPQAMLSSPRCPRDAVRSPQAQIRSARPRSTWVARFTVVANMSTRADVSDEMDGCPARRHYERWIQVRSWCEL